MPQYASEYREDMGISAMDIAALVKDPSPNVRAGLADKIAYAIKHDDFSKTEQAIAMDILRILARDVEIQVRRSVALSLSHSMTAPHDLIWHMANDVSDVAMPILQHSFVLSEEDLIAIVNSTKEVMKQVGIAGRESISEALAEELLATEDIKVCHTLLLNKGASISEESLTHRFTKLTGSTTLLEALVHRGNLPIRIAEKLFTVVSDELKTHLSKQYRLPMAIVEDNIEDIREWTTLQMLVPDDARHEISDHELDSLVHQLYTGNRLTYSMVIRALCGGDIAFFETAMARLAGVPRANARLLLFDSGELGFRAFYEKAHMPNAFYDAIRAFLKLSLELTAYGRVKREDFRGRIIERIREEKLDQTVDNMQYLLTVIGGHFASSANVH